MFCCFLKKFLFLRIFCSPAGISKTTDPTGATLLLALEDLLAEGNELWGIKGLLWFSLSHVHNSELFQELMWLIFTDLVKTILVPIHIYPGVAGYPGYSQGLAQSSVFPFNLSVFLACGVIRNLSFFHSESWCSCNLSFYIGCTIHSYK